MKVSYTPAHASGKRHSYIENTPKIVLVLILALVLLTIIPLYFFPLLGFLTPWRSSTPPPPALGRHKVDVVASTRIKGAKRCDIFRGEWVPNPSAPYYTNATCWAIHEHQNCMKYGRPDTGFLKWRWKPDGCSLPVFNPALFLELVRGKSLAFVGDSVGRNQMQSLMCLLTKVTYATDVTNNTDYNSRRMYFPTHDFTLANFWSPYLVKSENADPNGPVYTSVFNLYLDEPDPSWTAHVAQFDYVIVSAGHWFFRPSMYYERSRLVGCFYCHNTTVTDLTNYYGYRMAFRTAFRALLGLRGYRGTTILRTFAPSHFENGPWDKGGDCVRRRPFMSSETRLDGLNLEMYMTQLEEFRAAEVVARGRGLGFWLMDVTEAMLLRPDGHPGRYGRMPSVDNATRFNDCVHWCLPGPVDVFSDFLLQMMKTEGSRALSARILGR